jgi:hypothetical protein
VVENIIDRTFTFPQLNFGELTARADPCPKSGGKKILIDLP